MKVAYRWHDPSVFADAAVHHAYPTFFTAKLYRDMNRLLARDGGFLCFARAVEMTAYMPCLQTHGRVRNVYELTPEAQQIYRAVCALRRDGEVRPIRPLVLEFPEDENTWDIADEFMAGDNLLVAPVLTDATERCIYLPRGRWQGAEGVYDIISTGRWVTVSTPLDRLPVFERKE